MLEQVEFAQHTRKLLQKEYSKRHFLWLDILLKSLGLKSFYEIVRKYSFVNISTILFDNLANSCEY